MDSLANTSTTAVRPLEATLSLVNDKLHIMGKAGTFEPIHTDYIPPYGDNLGYMPLQLLLISFGACASAAVLTILRRMEKNIVSWNVKLNGLRREQHPMGFSQITAEFILTSPNTTEADVRKALMLSEQSFCPVWAMIKGNVEVLTTITIHASIQTVQESY